MKLMKKKKLKIKNLYYVYYLIFQYATIIQDIII